MLAYYSSLIKKECIRDRIEDEAIDASGDAQEISSSLNSVSHACDCGDLERALDMLKLAEEQTKELHAMIVNLQGNLQSYVNSLCPDKEVQTRPVHNTEENVKSQPESSEISDLVKSIQDLKDLQASLK